MTNTNIEYCMPDQQSSAQIFANGSPTLVRCFFQRNAIDLSDIKEEKRREERARTAQLIQQAIDDETIIDDEQEGNVALPSNDNRLSATRSAEACSVYRKLGAYKPEPPLLVKSLSTLSSSPSAKKSYSRSSKPDLGMMVEVMQQPTYDESDSRSFRYFQEDFYFDYCMLASMDEVDDGCFGFTKFNSAETVDTMPSETVDDNNIKLPITAPVTVVGAPVNDTQKKRWRWLSLFSFASCMSL